MSSVFTKNKRHSIRFEREPKGDNLFHPTQTFSLLFADDGAAPIGKIVRTYRNEPNLFPGREVWVYLRDDSPLHCVESFVSGEDLEKWVLKRFNQASASEFRELKGGAD